MSDRWDAVGAKLANESIGTCAFSGCGHPECDNERSRFASALRAAYAEGVEDAARLCDADVKRNEDAADRVARDRDLVGEWTCNGQAVTAELLAKAIRALAPPGDRKAGGGGHG